MSPYGDSNFLPPPPFGVGLFAVLVAPHVSMIMFKFQLDPIMDVVVAVSTKEVVLSQQLADFLRPLHSNRSTS